MFPVKIEEVKLNLWDGDIDLAGARIDLYAGTLAIGKLWLELGHEFEMSFLI